MRAAWFIGKFELLLNCTKYPNYSPKSRTPQQPQNVSSLNYFVDNQIVIVSDNAPEKVVNLEKGAGPRNKIQTLLQTVNQMTKEGWEIINVTEFNQVLTYFLKRK
jgi:hypothetical protein